MRKANEQPVRIGRMTIPGLLHPIVLHSLCFAPNEDVLETTVAKVIAWVVYNEALRYVVFEFVESLMNMGAIIWFVRYCRKESGVETNWHFLDGRKVHILSFALMSIVLILRVLVEMIRLSVSIKMKIITDYMSAGRVAQYLQLVLQGGVCYWANPSMDIEPHVQNLRMALALLGAHVSMSFLDTLMGVELWDLGMTILPIFGALKQVAPFLSAMFFFAGGAYMFIYSLSGQPMSKIMVHTYQMSFNLNDYEEKMVVDKHAETGVWILMIAGYAFFGIVITVALNNIFIGIMGNAYDDQHEKAKQLFVRKRLLTGLHWQLLKHGLPNCLVKPPNYTDCIWYCEPAKSEEELAESADSKQSKGD